MTKRYSILKTALEPVLMKVKRAAGAAVNRAVKQGLLPHIRSQSCNYCKQQAHHYHHYSYTPDKWLTVLPLCARCHKVLHTVGYFQVVDERIKDVERDIRLRKSMSAQIAKELGRTYDDPKLRALEDELYHLKNFVHF